MADLTVFETRIDGETVSAGTGERIIAFSGIGFLGNNPTHGSFAGTDGVLKILRNVVDELGGAGLSAGMFTFVEVLIGVFGRKIDGVGEKVTFGRVGGRVTIGGAVGLMFGGHNPVHNFNTIARIATALEKGAIFFGFTGAIFDGRTIFEIALLN